MESFKVNQSLRFKMNATSGGDQLKWYKDGMYIKSDTYGYESISEALTSELFSCIDGVDFVDYFLCYIIENSNKYTGCYSFDICKSERYRLISLYRLLQMYISNIDDELYGLEDEDLYMFVCSESSSITDLNMEDYINKLILMDYIIFNSDRHLNNIFVLYDVDSDKFNYAPVLDNGAALFSNIDIFPLSKSYNYMKSIVSCKPFCSDFDEQLELSDGILRIKYDEFLERIDGDYIGFNKSYYDRALNILKLRLKETYGRVWIKC